MSTNLTVERMRHAAIETIERFVERKEEKLNLAASDARIYHIERLKAMAIHGMPQNHILYPLGQLIAETLDVSESTGVPIMVLPVETRRILIAANYAGMIPDCTIGLLQWDGPDFMSLCIHPEEQRFDLTAWMSAKEYRETQTIHDITGKI